MEEFIKIPGKGKYKLTLLVELLEYLRKISWKYRIWRFSPALVDKVGGTIRYYIGQNFDEKYFELVEDGWTHDHCEICIQQITNNDIGYESEDNNNWVCQSCYEIFLKPNDIDKVLQSLKEK